MIKFSQNKFACEKVIYLLVGAWKQLISLISSSSVSLEIDSDSMDLQKWNSTSGYVIMTGKLSWKSGLMPLLNQRRMPTTSTRSKRMMQMPSKGMILNKCARILCSYNDLPSKPCSKVMSIVLTAQASLFQYPLPANHRKGRKHNKRTQLKWASAVRLPLM